MNRGLQLAFYIFLLILMLVTVVWASLQQNLFTEFSWTASPMWFKTTLVDFYINQFILWIWVACIEKKNFIKIFWLFVFLTLGSIGTTSFIIYRILTKKPLLREK